MVRFSVEMVFALTKQSCLSAAAAATATAEPEAAPAPKFVAFTALKEQRRQQQAAAAPEPEPEPEPGLQQPVALCKFWARGGCSRGERCHFRHEYRDITEQQRTAIRHSRAAAARAALRAADAGTDPFKSGDKAAHGERHVEFARWIVDSFGLQALRAR